MVVSEYLERDEQRLGMMDATLLKHTRAFKVAIVSAREHAALNEYKKAHAAAHTLLGTIMNVHQQVINERPHIHAQRTLDNVLAKVTHDGNEKTLIHVRAIITHLRKDIALIERTNRNLRSEHTKQDLAEFTQSIDTLRDHIMAHWRGAWVPNDALLERMLLLGSRIADVHDLYMREVKTLDITIRHRFKGFL